MRSIQCKAFQSILVVLISLFFISSVVAKEIYQANLSGKDLKMIKQLPLFNPDIPGEIIGFYDYQAAIPTAATGTLKLEIVNEEEIHYTLNVAHEKLWTNIDGTPGTFGASHIHLGPKASYGPIMFVIYDRRIPGIEPFNGELSGVLRADNLFTESVNYGPNQPTQLGDYGIKTMQDAIDAIRQGNTYINVHTSRHWLGEIAGQIQAVKKQHNYIRN